MDDALVIRREDLVSNPTPRVPVCLCLDTSSSMAGAPIAELNEGVQAFVQALRDDEVAQFAAEIAIVTFGDTPTRVLDFDALSRQTVPTLDAYGGTPMGGGVHLALDLLEARKREYKSVGVDYYQPWLVLMTDGQPTDPIEGSVERVVAELEARRLTLFPIGIGAGADMTTLARFSPRRSPLRLRGLSFRSFFEWLSKSVSRVSQSIPGDAVPLDTKGIAGWGEV